MNTPLPPLPASWSALTWQQLCEAWTVKQRYGGNADVARAAAVLALLGLEPLRMERESFHPVSGEKVYVLRDSDGLLWTAVPRELSQMARQALPWFDYPYGDPGKPAVKDDSGKVVEEAVNPVRGYVNPYWRDAMALPEETVMVQGSWLRVKGSRHFALPQVACNNLTWQQYRSLQGITPQLFADGIGEDDALDLQAQFLSHCLVPRSLALLDTTGGSIRLRPHYTYQYNAERAEGLVPFWKRQLASAEPSSSSYRDSGKALAPILFHICFQCYQTALAYYAQAYPLLFGDDGKKDPMKDALQGEVGTINTIMKYAGYAEQQQVYDSNLPFVLDILNTMTKEAKEIEKMNARIKKK